MAATTMMHIRVDEETKAQAAQTLEVLGMSLSDAVRLFLKRVVLEQGFPISLKVPNKETLAAIEEAKAIENPRFSNIGELIDAIEEDISGEKGQSSAKKRLR